MRKPAKRGEPRRFLEQVAIPFTGDECLAWPFSHNSSGYANMADPRDWRKTICVNRLLCEHQEGPAPADKPQAAHRCGKEWCVNPKHIRWASALENTADKVVHGTLKLSEDRFVTPGGVVRYPTTEREYYRRTHPSRKIVGSPQWAEAQIVLAERVGTVVTTVAAQALVDRAPDSLTVNQRAALTYIAGFIEEHKFPPSYPEIARAIGVAGAGSVHKIVHHLAKVGLIEIVGHGKRRGIRVIPWLSEVTGVAA